MIDRLALSLTVLFGILFTMGTSQSAPTYTVSNNFYVNEASISMSSSSVSYTVTTPFDISILAYREPFYAFSTASRLNINTADFVFYFMTSMSSWNKTAMVLQISSTVDQSTGTYMGFGASS